MGRDAEKADDEDTKEGLDYLKEEEKQEGGEKEKKNQRMT